MCGIAGFSLGHASPIDPLQAARVLLASIAERGADAAGCAYWHDGAISVEKQPGGASHFLQRLGAGFHLPERQRQLLLHVRDHTKGRPSLSANNHPIRHGSIVGVHNGRIRNDEVIFRELGCARAEEGMTVDSEAIFALLHRVGDVPAALGRLRGALATGWLDEAHADSVFLARGYGRPLWLATTSDGRDTLWASTLEALEITEEFLGIELHKRPMRPGTVVRVTDGVITARTRFVPDAGASWLRNPVASPHERTACLARLEPLAAARIA